MQAQAADIQPVIGYETTLLLNSLAINFTFIAKTNTGLKIFIVFRVRKILALTIFQTCKVT
jgi:hypothetical protein